LTITQLYHTEISFFVAYYTITLSPASDILCLRYKECNEMGKFVLKPVKDQFRFVLKAGNGEIILQSEQYTTKAAANNGVESVRKNCVREDAFEVKMVKDQYHFVLKATNGQIIGQSELYKSEASCMNGIESVQKNAPEAELVDETE
jgi:uncharacterized protein